MRCCISVSKIRYPFHLKEESIYLLKCLIQQTFFSHSLSLVSKKSKLVLYVVCRLISFVTIEVSLFKHSIYLGNCPVQSIFFQSPTLPRCIRMVDIYVCFFLFLQSYLGHSLWSMFKNTNRFVKFFLTAYCNLVL